ncbi:unnamed protein product [Cunninghamella blakesleeana]
MATAMTSDYWTQLSQSMIDTTIGDYQFVQDLGHGSYGGLFLGQHLKTKSYVAIKVLNKSGLNDQQLKLQQLEIDIQSSFQHESLLSLHETLQDQDYIYMVMELCDQGDLFDFVLYDQDQLKNDYRSEAIVKKFFIQILKGLEYMHAKGVYHRDIKLENILLKSNPNATNDDDDDDMNDLICKVADFGLATRDRYSMEFGCGSATYLAPEHFADEDEMLLKNNNQQQEDENDEELMPYDSAASDIWSLGILLLALMFGRNPWQESNYTDGAFNEYIKNPIMLKHQLFPNMSWDLYQFLYQHVLVVNPSKRVTITEMIKKFNQISHLYTSEDDEDDEEDYMVSTPVDIPTNNELQQQQQKQQELTTNGGKPRYDSAIFSMDPPTTQGMSWSDMVEEDLYDDHYPESSSSSIHEDDHPTYDDEDDTDMFIHNDEKESWWL